LGPAELSRYDLVGGPSRTLQHIFSEKLLRNFGKR
jgi:hypothetical protein